MITSALSAPTTEDGGHAEHAPSGRRSWKLAAAAAVGLATVGHVHAMELDTGNPDLSLRLDTDVRYNIGVRAQGRNAAISNSTGSQSSDYAFGRGDIVTNRLDILTQLDLAYKRDFGLHLSGAAWYDQAYEGKVPENNPGVEPVTGLPYSTFNGYPDGRYAHSVKRYYAGPSAEMLDAFVYGKFDLRGVPLSVKLGQFAAFWGEALFFDGVAYSQSPVDQRKGAANPGTTAKELFLPIAQVTLDAQLTEALSVGMQVPLDWKGSRYPEGSTYLGPADAGFAGPTRLVLPAAPGFALPLARSEDVQGKNRDAFGVKMRWSPEWAKGGTLGAYYRRFDEVDPWLQLNLADAQYRLAYPKGTKLYGLSASGTVQGVSVAAEVARRQNTGLYAESSTYTAGPADGPRGDVTYALLNAISYLGKTEVFDSMVISAELAHGRLNKVLSNADAFSEAGTAACVSGGTPGNSAATGCATRSWTAFGISLVPKWEAVFAGVDLSVPITFIRGLKGNPAASGGQPAEGTGAWSAGVTADINFKHTVSLFYNGYTSKITDGRLNRSTLGDRGWVSLTYKTSF